MLLPQDLRLHVLQAVFGIGLAMIGPGVWSVDASFYNWNESKYPPERVNFAPPNEATPLPQTMG